MSPFGVPEITPAELSARLEEGDAPLVLDVREPYELEMARLEHDILTVPLSRLAADRLDALPAALADRTAELVVLCHHGTRSAQVVAWLRQEGWTNVFNLKGGIDAYARDVDPSVDVY